MLFFEEWKDGYVRRDGHIVKLDANGVVVDDKTASLTGVSYVGKCLPVQTD